MLFTFTKNRVARGVERLSQARPLWDTEVIVHWLYLDSATQCVLGQVYGHYARGLIELDVKPSQAAEYGFVARGSFDQRLLERAWAKAIKARRRTRQTTGVAA